jgi:hypothetical protein
MAMARWILAIGLALTVASAPAADSKPKPTPKEALQALQVLIGSWKGTGSPEGTREEKLRGFWVETTRWEWQFKGNDVWLKVDFEKGRYFTNGEVRFQPEKEVYELKLNTVDKQALVFAGPLKDRKLTLERFDEAKNETQRLVFTLIHDNRVLYHYETQPRDRTVVRRHYQVGCTKEGVAFANPTSTEPECVVSGGLGTTRVTYKGETYYVCCSGCRDAFNENPEKYIKEYKEKKAKEKEKKP